MIDFEYIDVRHLQDLPAVLDPQWGKCAMLAGGTDLLDRLKERLATPERVVNIKHIEELQGIEYGRTLDIGALTTLAELAADARIERDFAVLAQAAGSVATPLLRTMGTLGGNLCQRPRCWYFRKREYLCRKKGGTRCFARLALNQNHAIFGGGICYILHPSDTAPALQALGARLELFGPQGRRELPLAEFFQRPEQNTLYENALQANEVVTRIRIPAPPTGRRSTYLKFRAKQSLDFALASVAAVLQMDGDRVQQARVVLGGVAPVPWPAPAAEAELEGRTLSGATIARAAAAAVAGARPIEPAGDNGYKIALTRNLVRRALERLNTA